jgi:hypothetical protein
MRNRTHQVLVATLSAAALSAWTHGSATPTFANWHAAVEGIPCQKVSRVGDDLRINEPIIVAGQTLQNPLVPEKGQAKLLERRCFARR